MNTTGFGCRIVVLILREENFTTRKYSIYGSLHRLSVYLNIAECVIMCMCGYHSSAYTVYSECMRRFSHSARTKARNNILYEATDY